MEETAAATAAAARSLACYGDDDIEVRLHVLLLLTYDLCTDGGGWRGARRDR